MTEKDLIKHSAWLNANKVTLNVAKIEVIPFQTKHKTLHQGIETSV